MTYHRHHHKLTKLYLEDVEADSAAFINVWVVHRGGEPDQWDNSNGLVSTPNCSSTFSREYKNLIWGGSKG